MQRINREKLLHQLESVMAGLSTREIIEQSSCFVFEGGMVKTFNDEISCSHDCEMKVEGAVQSVPLLAILRKLPEDELDVELTSDGTLQIKGKRRTVEIRYEKEVLLRVDKVEKPDKWIELHKDFLDGVALVQHCAGSDESKFELTCIHIHPDFIEACDNFQATRVTMDTGIQKPTLVRRASLKHVSALGMTDFSETQTWIHFKNPDGLILSCRRFANEYKDISKLLNFKGDLITIPKGLGDAADKAQVFSSENPEDNFVSVELRPNNGGQLRITGEGASGRYYEFKDLKYSGPAMQFLIAPELLIELTQKHNQTEAEITDGRLRVDGGKWVYMTCLTAPGSEPNPKEEKKGKKKEDAGRDND